MEHLAVADQWPTVLISGDHCKAAYSNAEKGRWAALRVAREGK